MELLANIIIEILKGNIEVIVWAADVSMTISLFAAQGIHLFRMARFQRIINELAEEKLLNRG